MGCLSCRLITSRDAVSRHAAARSSFRQTREEAAMAQEQEQPHCSTQFTRQGKAVGMPAPHTYISVNEDEEEEVSIVLATKSHLQNR